jgi:hypothetical protein
MAQYEQHFIVHPDSETYIPADECLYVITTNVEQIEALCNEGMQMIENAEKLGAKVYHVEPETP